MGLDGGLAQFSSIKSIPTMAGEESTVFRVCRYTCHQISSPPMVTLSEIRTIACTMEANLVINGLYGVPPPDPPRDLFDSIHYLHCFKFGDNISLLKLRFWWILTHDERSCPSWRSPKHIWYYKSCVVFVYFGGDALSTQSGSTP